MYITIDGNNPYVFHIMISTLWLAYSQINWLKC